MTAYAPVVDPSLLGRHLADLRRKRGLKQEEVAGKLGDVSRQTVSHWEVGRAPVTVRDLERLATIYGCRVNVEVVPLDAAKVTIETSPDGARLARATEDLPPGDRETLYELAEVIPLLPSGARTSLPVMVNGWRRDYLFSRSRNRSNE